MTTNVDLARQVAKHVQLRSIALRSANIDSDLSDDDDQLDLTVTQQHRCSVDHQVKGDRREVRVLAEFKFTASKSESEDGSVVRLDATFVLVYEMSSTAEFEPRCIQYFADINGAYNAWPYWRELVQSAAGRVGMAGIVIPVYRPTPVIVSDGVEANSLPPGDKIKKGSLVATKVATKKK